LQVTADDREFLVAMATRLCRSVCDPHDLVQDVLERAVKHAHSIPAEDPRPWMLRVMRNLFVDRVRHQARRPQHDRIDEAVVAQPALDAPAWWQRLDADDIRRAAATLPGELREVFELFAFEGLSYDQIVARLGVPKNTVGTRILRARRRLRASFAGGEGGGDE
jgi:RNA polymerase sigma-70 factor, ECF subfamily